MKLQKFKLQFNEWKSSLNTKEQSAIQEELRTQLNQFFKVDYWFYKEGIVAEIKFISERHEVSFTSQQISRLAKKGFDKYGFILENVVLDAPVEEDAAAAAAVVVEDAAAVVVVVDEYEEPAVRDAAAIEHEKAAAFKYRMNMYVNEFEQATNNETIDEEQIRAIDDRTDALMSEVRRRWHEPASAPASGFFQPAPQDKTIWQRFMEILVSIKNWIQAFFNCNNTLSPAI